MPKHIKLALLGGDMRQISVAQELSRFGFTTELWGIDKEFCVSSDICLCNEWSETINNCDALVLPLPASADGVRVNCPLLSDSAGVKLSKLLDLIPRETLILGGKFSPSLKLMMSDKGFRYIDYFIYSISHIAFDLSKFKVVFASSKCSARTCEHWTPLFLPLLRAQRELPSFVLV